MCEVLRPQGLGWVSGRLEPDWWGEGGGGCRGSPEAVAGPGPGCRWWLRAAGLCHKRTWPGLGGQRSLG